MDWRQGARNANWNSPSERIGRDKYGTLFSESITLREFFENNHDTLREICRKQADEIYLGKDPKTLIRDAMRDLIEQDYAPNLILDGSQPTQQTNVPGFVGVRHWIRVDKNLRALMWQLPPHLKTNGLSEYAAVDAKAGLPDHAKSLDETQHFIELQYYFPQDVWDSGKPGWLQAQVESDVQWLKAVIDDFHAAFKENTRNLTTLIHTEILDKWQSTMDVAGEVEHARLPEEDIDGNVSVPKEAPYSVHKNYLFGGQEGVCNGCEQRFCFEQMTVDHIFAQSKGGGHELANLQLLCQPCNNLKADDSQEELLARLTAQKPTNPPCCQC